PGEVNWMTAGAGIVHSERSVGEARKLGGSLHGMQSWIALPVEEEERSPSFAHLGAPELPQLSGRGLSGRLIAGSAYGLSSPVSTHSPLFYLHLDLTDDAVVSLPNEHQERAAYIVEGAVEHENRTYEQGQLLVFIPGEAALRTPKSARVMLLGGAPIGER